MTCTSCRNSIVLPPLAQNQAVLCHTCGKEFRVWTFPALHKPPPTSTPAARVMVDGEASCFFHPTKAASIPCDQCGRFLCSLCDLDFGGKHYCPSCIDSTKKKAKTTDLEVNRTTYDSAALLLALLPILIWPVTLVSAPAALFYSIRAFRSPGSLVPRKPWRAILALVLSSLQILGWIVLIIALITS